jgi:hypothetical protein
VPLASPVCSRGEGVQKHLAGRKVEFARRRSHATRLLSFVYRFILVLRLSSVVVLNLRVKEPDRSRYFVGLHPMSLE